MEQRRHVVEAASLKIQSLKILLVVLKKMIQTHWRDLRGIAVGAAQSSRMYLGRGSTTLKLAVQEQSGA